MIKRTAEEEYKFYSDQKTKAENGFISTIYSKLFDSMGTIIGLIVGTLVSVVFLLFVEGIIALFLKTIFNIPLGISTFFIIGFFDGIPVYFGLHFLKKYREKQIDKINTILENIDRNDEIKGRRV